MVFTPNTDHVMHIKPGIISFLFVADRRGTRCGLLLLHGSPCCSEMFLCIHQHVYNQLCSDISEVTTAAHWIACCKQRGLSLKSLKLSFWCSGWTSAAHLHHVHMHRYTECLTRDWLIKIFALLSTWTGVPAECTLWKWKFAVGHSSLLGSSYFAFSFQWRHIF